MRIGQVFLRCYETPLSSLSIHFIPNSFPVRRIFLCCLFGGAVCSSMGQVLEQSLEPKGGCI